MKFLKSKASRYAMMSTFCYIKMGGYFVYGLYESWMISVVGIILGICGVIFHGMFVSELTESKEEYKGKYIHD